MGGNRSTGTCLWCGEYFESTTYKATYCSNSCSSLHKGKKQFDRKVALWKSGELSGSNGNSYVSLAPWLRRYMLEKVKYACEECGWDKRHPESGTSPLEIHHLDGDILNNDEYNLRVLCPNCHSLTANHGARNKKSKNDLSVIRGYRSREYLEKKKKRNLG